MPCFQRTTQIKIGGLYTQNRDHIVADEAIFPSIANKATICTLHMLLDTASRKQNVVISNAFLLNVSRSLDNDWHGKSNWAVRYYSKTSKISNIVEINCHAKMGLVCFGNSAIAGIIINSLQF